jgi:hypothetical protein
MVLSKSVTPETFKSRKVINIGLMTVQALPGVARVIRNKPHHTSVSPK